jgi:hypothetical protein
MPKSPETITEIMPGEEEKSPPLSDLLQQFETTLEAKKIKLEEQTERQEREEVESAQNFSKALAEYFGEMAEKGTFDELKNLNLDERLREVLAASGEPMPGNFKEESESIKKTITYLEKYEKMVEQGQDDEKLRSLAANLRTEGEKILKKRASLLKENLDKIAEARRVELEQIKKAGGALDILTAEPRLEKENYGQYKERFINEIVEREENAIREYIIREKKETDQNRRAGETLEAAIRLFGEEKLTKIVDIIEKEFVSEEERREALEFVKKRYFGGKEQIFKYYINHVFEIPFLPKEKGEKSNEIPQWIISVAKEVSEFNIFKKIVSYGTYNEGLELMILLNQYLRHKLGEDTPCLTSVYEDVNLEGDTKIARVKIGTTKEDYILNRELFIKAASVIEMIKKTSGDFYKFDTLRKLS